MPPPPLSKKKKITAESTTHHFVSKGTTVPYQRPLWTTICTQQTRRSLAHALPHFQGVHPAATAFLQPFWATICGNFKPPKFAIEFLRYDWRTTLLETSQPQTTISSPKCPPHVHISAFIVPFLIIFPSVNLACMNCMISERILSWYQLNFYQKFRVERRTLHYVNLIELVTRHSVESFLFFFFGFLFAKFILMYVFSFSYF